MNRIFQIQRTEEFNELYRTYYGMLVNFAYSGCRDWELSREVVQHCFVRLWERKDELEINRSIRSYLFTMVKNALIDHYKRQEKLTNLSEWNEDTEARSVLSFDEEDILAIRYAIKKALNGMKEKRRSIFEMSRFEGLTYSEIASYLGISERAVEDNMAKALEEIRKVIKQ